MSELDLIPAVIDEGGTVDIITETQRQEALLKTGALQNAIFNSANFSSIATDARGVIQIFNVGAERMLGYAASEVMNKITPADISDPQEVITRAKELSVELETTITPGFEALVFKASRGIEDIYELTYIRKDGSRFPAVVSVTALRDAQDVIIGYLLIGTDNTARKQIEAERQHLLDKQEETHKQLLQAHVTLRDNEEKLAVTLNSIGDAVIATDANARVTLLNPLAEQLTGWTQAEATGRPVDEIFHIINKETRQPSTIPVMETLAHGTMQGLANHTVVIARDGSECDIADSCAPIRDRDGQVIGAVLVFRDVTEEYAVQQALRESKERLSFTLQMTHIGGWNLNLKDGTAHRTLEHDRIFGYDSLLPKWSYEIFLKYVLPEDRTEVDRLFREAGAAQTDWNFECRIRRQDGEVRWIWATGQHQRDNTGHTSHMAGIVQDITERKQVEAERALYYQVLQENNVELESAKFIAEKANLAKSDFLSSMSHELRSPLNAILGFAQLMESEVPPPTPNQKASINQILQAGWYLLELINEILDLALIESGRLSLSPEPVSLADVLGDCHAMIESQAEKSGIQLSFPQLDNLRFVGADRTRMKQVLINLLSNAIKYNRVGGKVEVRCGANIGGRIRISVHDTGEGLSADKLAQLFQPFNRLGQEMGVEQGTGIGLVVSKQLVELMGGEIGVQSSVGVGSVFWIELNAAVAPHIAFAGTELIAVALTQVDVNAQLRSVLCVEDNPANLMLIETLLARRPDIGLLTARDGTRGIEIARTSQPDVILMDINLPGISGITALKILREDPATAHIPVIALSANAMPRDIEKGLEAGFFRYLTKPIKVNEFMDTLNDALKLSEIGWIDELIDTNETDK
jgi:PAS domain S-box-containing protein